MDTKRVLKAVWVATGVLILFFVGYAFPPLPRIKARAQRISAVNHVAHVSATLTWSNTPAPASTLPRTGK
jgi:hypothetical protein